MSNSKLVNYTKISPNSNARNHKIDKITIHHMAGNLSVETCGNVFQNRAASSNYGVGSDGRVGLYVPENRRSWATSSASNDHRAVTIEVANDGGAPNWHVSDKALAKTIDLVVDICKRNGIERLNYTGNKTGNLTMHRWYASTSCPGPYLASKFPYIAEEVNKRLAGTTETPKEEKVETAKELYRVRKAWADAKSQKGAFVDLARAKALADNNPGYKVYNKTGKLVYPVSFKSYLVTVTASVLNVRKGPGTNYGIAETLKRGGAYTIVEESNGWGKLKSGAGWIKLSYTERV